MGKRLSSNLRKVGGPPEGEPWVWLTAELITSCAWRGQSIHCRRLIDFLVREHMAHAGTENGNLAAPYDQLNTFGIGRRFIPEAIGEAETLGLIAVHRGGKRNLVEDYASRYRLTWLPAKSVDQFSRYFVAPTNEWKRTTVDDVRAIRTKRSADRAKKRALGTPRVNRTTGKLPLRSVHHG